MVFLIVPWGSHLSQITWGQNPPGGALNLEDCMEREKGFDPV